MYVHQNLTQRSVNWERVAPQYFQFVHRQDLKCFVDGTAGWDGRILNANDHFRPWVSWWRQADIVMGKPMKFSCMRKPKARCAGHRAVEVESKSTGLHRQSLLFLICMWILSTGSEVYGVVQFCSSEQQYLTFRDSTLCTFATGCTSISLQKRIDSVSNIARLLAEGSGFQSRLNPAIPNGLIVVCLSHAESQITSVHFRT